MTPPIIFVWNGTEMIPHPRLRQLADSSFTAGHAYRLIVQEEGARRTGEQNNKMWAMLTEISQQKEHCGRHYSPDQWKVLFMHAWGRKVEFLPSLDNSTFVPYPYQSSKLGKKAMTELIEFIAAWSAQNGIVFRDDPGAAA